MKPEKEVRESEQVSGQSDWPMVQPGGGAQMS